MDASIVIPALTTAISVGLGCGTCCSPIISMFLSTYVISHADSVKRGIFSFLSFFMGKLLSVSSLCVAASIVSRQFISPDGYIGNFNLRLTAQIAMSIIGVVMAAKWFFENTQSQKVCKDCHSCAKPKGKAGFWPMLAAGFTYGITPCAPLLLMIGYSFTLPVSIAGVTGIAFSLSSMVSPVLLLVVITGALSKQIAKEIPQHIKWFRLGSYLLLAVMPFVINRL